MACNLIYTHLLDLRSHVEECSRQGCAQGCDVTDFHRTLEQPLLWFEIVRERQAHERRAALERGEINWEVA